MKLYATTTSDKHGREAKKGGDNYLFTKYMRGNTHIGTLQVYEIMDYITRDGQNGELWSGPEWKPANGYRIYWQPATGEKIEIYNSDNDKHRHTWLDIDSTNGKYGNEYCENCGLMRLKQSDNDNRTGGQ